MNRHNKPTMPATWRGADFLPRAYGYESLDSMCDSIPESAVILDIGAGRSNLGAAITKKRKDITWTNIDPYYNDSSIADLKRVHGEHCNLSYDQSSALDLKAYVGKADRVFSSWMLPILCLQDEELATQALNQMVASLKPGKSELRLTPLVGLRDPKKQETMWRHALCNPNATESELGQIVKQSTLPPNLAWKHRAGHRSGVSRICPDFSHDVPGKPKFYDFRNEKFVSPASPTVAKWLIAMTMEGGAYYATLIQNLLPVRAS